MPPDTEEIQQLLTQALPPIEKYYEYIAQHPSWNIFYALGKTKYLDELIHSYFLATVLRTKIDGKFIFLQLFLDLLRQKFSYEYNAADLHQTPHIETEYSIGPITQDYMSGGRIDLLVKISDKILVIENKIGADDQPKQLYRYFKKFPEAQLLYLTLTGYEPSKESLYKLEEEGGTYECLSYKKDILSWLKSCAAELDKPNNMPCFWIEQLQTNLSQYQKILEDLTDEGAKKSMNEEIIKIANVNKNNFMSALHIGRNYTEIFNQTIREKLIHPLRQFVGPDFKIEETGTPDKIAGILIYKESWKHIALRFNSEHWEGLTALYGLSKINKKVTFSETLKDYFNEKHFPSYRRTQYWPLIGELAYSVNEDDTAVKLWDEEESAKILEHFKDKIAELMKIVQQAEKDGIEL